MKSEKHINELRHLLASSDHATQRLNDIVQKAVEEEKLISGKLIDADLDENLSFGEQLSDKIAEFGGSWRFIIVFLGIIIGWIVLNTFLILQKPFDPYPYILLNLVLSCVAAIQAPLIMMSQNRQEAKDRRRAKSDYLVNLKAEIEIRNLHEKLDWHIQEQMAQLQEINKNISALKKQ